MKSYLNVILVVFTLVFVGCSNNESLDSFSAEQKGTEDFKCETGFAYCEGQSTCFDELGFNRWGWSIGPVSQPDKNECVIYAGAGGCNLDKGVPVGVYEITYEDDSVLIHYHAYPGYLFTETHLYVGNAMYPVKPNGKPTVAPGQYPYSQDHGAGTDFVEYELDDEFTGEIYVIAHSVVCAE